MENCEQMFIEDLIDKKRTGSGARHRASRTGRKKGYMPAELLSKEDRKIYEAGGPVTTYYITPEVAKMERIYLTNKKPQAWRSNEQLSISACIAKQIKLGPHNLYHDKTRDVLCLAPAEDGELQIRAYGSTATIRSKDLVTFLEKWGPGITNYRCTLENGSIILRGAK